MLAFYEAAFQVSARALQNLVDFQRDTTNKALKCPVEIVMLLFLQIIEFIVRRYVHGIPLHHVRPVNLPKFVSFLCPPAKLWLQEVVL